MSDNFSIFLCRMLIDSEGQLVIVRSLSQLTFVMYSTNLFFPSSVITLVLYLTHVNSWLDGKLCETFIIA